MLSFHYTVYDGKNATNGFSVPVSDELDYYLRHLLCVQGHEGGQELPGSGKEAELCSGQ